MIEGESAAAADVLVKAVGGDSLCRREEFPPPQSTSTWTPWR
jgi:hypothetical protein